MRNLFDQYQAPENRLTHALASCLAEEPRLLRRFVRWATGRECPNGAQLRIAQQHVPGETEREEEEEEQAGLPDVWIFSKGTWSLLIENKVAAVVGVGQMRRHLRTAARHGFSDAVLLVLSPAVPQGLPEGVHHRRWTDVYRWAHRESRRSRWAQRLTEYLEVAERRMVAQEYLRDGTLTTFNGFRFDEDHPFTYREAKRLLNLATASLRQRTDLRRLGMDPRGSGRPAITGSGGTNVWDFIPLSAAKGGRLFTLHPHLTLSVDRSHVDAFVTLPHGARPEYRRRLVQLGRPAFARLGAELLRGFRPCLRMASCSSPRMYVTQRHYPSQRATPVTDARVEFDLRTAMAGGGGGVRFQPQWLDAAYEALAGKRSNLQFGAGVRFPYGRGPIESPVALDLIASAWLGCRPLLRILGALGLRQ
jgi:hypothetical protein